MEGAGVPNAALKLLGLPVRCARCAVHLGLLLAVLCPGKSMSDHVMVEFSYLTWGSIQHNPVSKK